MGCGASAEKYKKENTKSQRAGKEARQSSADKIINIGEFYDVDKNPIGQGSFGRTLKAKDKKSGTVRAVKIIRKHQFLNEKTIRRELTVMKSLDHPNICRFWETFEDKKSFYICMELLEGGDLLSRVAEAEQFSEKQAATLMQNMVRPLHYMHEQRFTHRDLKLENFLFVERRADDLSRGTLKLIDFGFSCKFEANQVLTTKCGSVMYAAPELVQGSYNHMVDMWSLGVILYILLSGYPPFTGDTDQQIMDKSRRGKVVFPEDDWKGVSREAQKLIHNLLRGPKDRYTAQEALEHRWLKENAPDNEDAHLAPEYLNKLRRFRGRNLLKKAALRAIAKDLDDQQINDLRACFTGLDKNGDGQLTAVELKLGLENAGMKNLPSGLEEAVNQVEKDGGAIHYNEFLAAALDKKYYTSEDVCWSAFNLFDRDGNGSISREELRAILAAEVDHALLDPYVDEVMNEVDTDGNHQIDFQEFMQMMKTTPFQTEAEAHTAFQSYKSQGSR
mmetsp:Transcript_64600/g.114914  ORF Transcript_64600/g.114914 Transcript_64600/m.114914 type:complete len:503 (+) Transcript_64600:52-1560(+)|eukprot:CAMPEP_0197629430 /NCGR_PEP_ID=MMETSP1338-20131121/7280_1 /TAXON_ID=43686 ORGANISM="Pelagodinium beii, Strain RCC1491" /NCGR_SAMPLE_ID=MMETSP1338 /ASSEMBLY_ACC=CAM_ASM_000754 /LENGTH=502 /DNA_ID=CAMNT_0043200467 /DNA_START=52 /DNA_END=1560 /DNA_ORIENTATION=-